MVEAGRSTRATGSRTRCMDRADTASHQVLCTLAAGLKARCKGRVKLKMLMGRHTRASGTRASGTERAVTLITIKLFGRAYLSKAVTIAKFKKR
jgi:hypothetical protein